MVPAQFAAHPFPDDSAFIYCAPSPFFSLFNPLAILASSPLSPKMSMYRFVESVQESMVSREILVSLPRSPALYTNHFLVVQTPSIRIQSSQRERPLFTR